MCFKEEKEETYKSSEEYPTTIQIIQYIDDILYEYSMKQKIITSNQKRMNLKKQNWLINKQCSEARKSED